MSADFVRAAETGSFSKTAREFSLSQPSVSRMVSSLEARLGIKLLLRTTRRVTPTDAGAVFLERTRRVLGDLDEAADAARGVDSLHGVLRVVMSGAFGTVGLCLAFTKHTSFRPSEPQNRLAEAFRAPPRAAWLENRRPLPPGPRVRIHLPPAASPLRTCWTSAEGSRPRPASANSGYEARGHTG